MLPYKMFQGDSAQYFQLQYEKFQKAYSPLGFGNIREEPYSVEIDIF
jgi:hypothetical protein